MAIEVHSISALVGRYINSVVNEQANEECPSLKAGAIKKLNKPDKLGVVNVKAGELASVKFLADGATLPSGRDLAPSQGTYLPVGLFARVSIPRMAAALASSAEDGVDIVKEQMDTCGKSLGRQLARGIYGTQLGSPAASVAAGDTTFTVADPAQWRVGMAFEVWNGSTAIEGSVESELLKVTKVAIPADGVGNTTITFTGSGSGSGAAAAWTTSYTLHSAGSKASNALMVGLPDVTSASSTLHGIAASGNEWQGITDSTTTTLTVGAMRTLVTSIVRRRSKKPSHILLNRRNEERYSNQLLNNRRFMSGKMDAVGGAAFEFEGIPLLTDENIGDAEMYFFQTEDVKLHVFRDFAPDFDGQASKSMGRGAMMVSDTQFAYDVQVWGAFNLRCERRNGCARLSALSG